MSERKIPRYPIYIPSKGRYDRCLTAKFLHEDDVPFHLVVEPQEADKYASEHGADRVLVLPFRDRGSSIPARNWIKQHSIEAGHARHWQLDDNITYVTRWYRRKRIRCRSGVALAAVEDFTDRYENVAIAGLNYHCFGIANRPPFSANKHVYSCVLVLNSLPYEWRGPYNEDTDLCLQALAGGWCTILVNAFLIKKKRTMTMPGGNTDELYQDDGRLEMARCLERRWPGIVKVIRRWGRPQHYVIDDWKRFKTPLKLRKGLSLDQFEGPDEYGMELTQVDPEVKGDLKQLLIEEGDG